MSTFRSIKMDVHMDDPNRIETETIAGDGYVATAMALDAIEVIAFMRTYEQATALAAMLHQAAANVIEHAGSLRRGEVGPVFGVRTAEGLHVGDMAGALRALVAGGEGE